MNHRSLAVRLAAGGACVAASLLGTGGQAVVAAPDVVPPAVPSTSPPPTTPAQPSSPFIAPAPLAGPDLRDPSTRPPIKVENVSMTGDAYVARQDVAAPAPPVTGRFPHVTTEVSRDLTTAFGSFADPGPFGRLALAGAPGGDTGAPAWAQCVFPKSPLTPTEDTRSPGQGAGPTAAATCRQGASRALGYLARDPGPGATAGALLIDAGASAALVDTSSNADGVTAVNSVSTLEDVDLANNVVIHAITNQVSLTTNGRPGGARVETKATIGGLVIGGQPVQLPSDSIQDLGPVLSQLAPVVSPLGSVTFSVIPEEKEVAADGTLAAGRAAQLAVTLKNGETTTTLALGYASARGRTILNEFTVPVPRSPTPGLAGGARPSPFGGGQSPLRPVGGYPYSLGNFVNSARSGGGFRPPPGGFVPPFPSTAPAPGPNQAALNLFPPPPKGSAAQPASRAGEPYGGSAPWLALIAASVIGLALARYWGYSAAAPGGAAS